MVYVIQVLNLNGIWVDARAADGQPLWFLTKREATQYAERLGNNYRIIRVKD